MRLFCLAVLALGGGMLVSLARADPNAGLLPPICLPQLPVLPCPPDGRPPPPPGAEERRPAVVTPTTVRYDLRRIVVRFRRGTTAQTREAVFARAGVATERALPKIRFYVVRAAAAEGRRDDALASLRREASVTAVERETIVDGLDTAPNDPAWGAQWGLRAAGFPRAWDTTRGSEKVVVAVLDTGVDGSHPDLAGALVPGFDFVNLDADASDDNGHGTATAGVVAARGDNRTGLAGACWSCVVLPVKVLAADGTGNTATIAAGVVWATDRGAKVINLSLGAPGTTDVLSEAVRYAVGRGVVLVAAAGNSGTAIPFYPAAEPSVLAVAATNENDRLYTWSNHGAWVQVAAPGCNVAPWPGAAYVELCGTSAAAPLVSGLAALIRAQRPQATAQTTVEAIEKAVVQIPADVRHGRVDAAGALGHIAALPRPQPATRRSAAFRGALTPRARSRLYERAVGAGRIVARLEFRVRRLSLWLAAPGRPVTRVSGKSPLRLVSTTRQGSVRLLVAGRPRRAAYRLTVSYVAP
jgi:subtilisin family serine protease